MSMFGSLEKDYEAWRESAEPRGVESAYADDFGCIVKEAFLAGAASIIGGAGKVKSQQGKQFIESFLVEYRGQVNKALAALGIMKEAS
jgi:hypothetical protein